MIESVFPCTDTPCCVGRVISVWPMLTTAALLLATCTAAGAVDAVSCTMNGAVETTVLFLATAVSRPSVVRFAITEPPVRFSMRILSSADAVVAIRPWNFTSGAPPLTHRPRPVFVMFMLVKLTGPDGTAATETAVCPAAVVICTSLTFAPPVSEASARMPTGAPVMARWSTIAPLRSVIALPELVSKGYAVAVPVAKNCW